MSFIFLCRILFPSLSVGLSYTAPQASSKLSPAIAFGKGFKAISKLAGVQNVIEDKRGIEDECSPERGIVEEAEWDDRIRWHSGWRGRFPKHVWKVVVSRGLKRCRCRRRGELEIFQKELLVIRGKTLGSQGDEIMDDTDPCSRLRRYSSYIAHTYMAPTGRNAL